MSSSILRKLPDFADASSAPAAGGIASIRSFEPLQGNATEEPGQDTEAVEVADAAAKEASEREAAEAAHLSELQALTVELEAAIQAMRIASDTKMREHLQMVAATLFPALADRYLADEVAALIPVLMTDITPQIRCTTTPEIAAVLEPQFTGKPSMAGRVEIVASEDIPPRRLEITWPEGGIDIDFDAALSRLSYEPEMPTLADEPIDHVYA